MRVVPQRQRQLSVSNLAWPADKDDEALDLVAGLGFDGVELAPGKVFGNLNLVSLDDVRAYRRQVEDRGLMIPALQGILFGVQGAHLFESSASRERMIAHLYRVAEVAEALNAKVCVFGAPSLRDPGALSAPEALNVAIEFLRTIAPEYASRGVELCFEANPPLYQCRFVTETEEAFELVEQVNAPGVAMQLDTGTIFINAEDPAVIGRVQHRIGHVHVSEPNLLPIGTGGVDHGPLADEVRNSTYSGWISIEMKLTGDWRSALREAYNLVGTLYCETKGAA
ncbi:sugar phosphate isomerase/epimerase family protein [Microvirga arabica]|uniref:Sugar phosphate isomerase/epimerase family protein n=1 Tax=Microvirga arabica TaxID=1128671 RepID=A0ABV6YB17_9HYPH